MVAIEDGDRFFSGTIKASTPKHLLEEGEVQRIINGRFIEGAITNALGFDELNIKAPNGYVPLANAPYSDVLKRGDLQLFASLRTSFGDYLILVIAGRILQVDIETLEAVDITPLDAFLPDESDDTFQLSYIDNDGDTVGAGGYLVIFNYPNKPIFISKDGARVSEALDYEMPSSRLGATAGNRAFVISGYNLMYASDPLGGASSLAPLTFQETLDPAGTYTGQIFTVGSSLDNEFVTAVCRIPRLLGSQQEFLAQNLLVSTKRKKYIISAGSPRANWENIQFITYNGSSDGVSGPLACTNIGSALVYISSTGRIKTISQDAERENTLSESFFDEGLGQFLNINEASYYYRIWYRELDHSYSQIKFTRDRLYATVYPTKAPALTKYNRNIDTITHRALAVGSLDSNTQIGPKASITWETFLDWMQPQRLSVLNDTLYIASKDKYGVLRFYRENNKKIDDHRTIIYTRGYFANNIQGKSRSIRDVYLYFRRITGNIRVKLYYLSNNTWVYAGECESSKNLFRMSIKDRICKTDSGSIALRVEVYHNGCAFELENIRVSGELHKDESKRFG